MTSPKNDMQQYVNVVICLLQKNGITRQDIKISMVASPIKPKNKTTQTPQKNSETKTKLYIYRRNLCMYHQK